MAVCSTCQGSGLQWQEQEVNEVLQARLRKAILTRNKAKFNSMMRYISRVAIAIEALAVVPSLPEKVQAWWYETMAPIVMARAEKEVIPEQKRAGSEWSQYYRGDAVVLSAAMQRLLTETGGLLYFDLVERLEAVRPQLPHPDCAVRDIVAVLMLELLHRKAIWQSEDCVFHSSEEFWVDYPAAVETALV